MQVQNHNPGIYLIIQFNWPKPADFREEHGKKAKKLHDSIQDKSWIKEVVAASGGIGGDLSSIWIFWMKNYAGLDILMKDPENEVSKAYNDFFKEMPEVKELIREEVIFI